MNLGNESEILEFKKTTGELDKAVDNIASMLNKHGYGTLYFGVSPNGDVTGQQISASSLNDVAKKIKDAIKPMIYPEVKEERLEEKTVIRVDFSGREKPYSSFGRYYKRVFDRTEEMTPDELKHMMAQTDNSSYWENNLTEYGIEAVDHDALLSFYKKAVACGRIEPMDVYDEEELLIGLGVYQESRFTNAGYYLFSKNKPVVLKLAVYISDERISFSDIARIEDNIFNLIGKGFSYIKEHINWRVQNGEGTSRVEVPEIPIEAIREIIVNSFAHANYRGVSEHEIDITPTEIEIYNPGEFPQNLSPEAFAREKIKSMPRNKVILNTLFKSKDVEIFGSGFRKVYNVCEKNNKRVGFSSGNGGFSFIFYRDIDGRDVSVNVTKNVTKNVEKRDNKSNSTEMIIYGLLREDPTQTREMIANKINKTVRTVQRYLDKLSSAGMIKRMGSNKTGYWEIL